MELRIRPIEPFEINVFSQILIEVALWLEARAEPLWSLESIQVAALLKKNTLNEFYLAFVADLPAACMILQDKDQAFWPADTQADSLYLHKLAVRREFAGLGFSLAMLDWAKERAKQQGKRFLKLDTAAANVKLNKLYQDYGFRYVGEIQLETFVASLYCLDLHDLQSLPQATSMSQA